MIAPSSSEPLIEVDDVQARLGETLVEPELSQANSFIVFASAILRSRRHLDIDNRMTSGDLDPELVKGTVTTAVVRALDATRVGLRVRSTQYPEITTSYTDIDPRLVYFTDSELGDLDPEAGNTSGNAFTIRVG
ncbi:hypothetical protein [Rhodococcus marinonascens]|uniref:hypothetical protein n=1 Tax=Rhodococcus marinonascens TaxID=38311 RepID=UPI000A64C7A9|nr:hypothetical protein [Rhodococcus marinonascens]